MKLLDLIKEKKITFIVGSFSILVLLFFLFSSPSSTPETSKANMIKHIEQNVGMRADVIGSQKRTQISVPFSFENEPFDLWLKYQKDELSNISYLMFHPTLQTLSWDVVREGELSLYQKESNYKSVTEFLDSPKGIVYADPEIVEKYPQFNFQEITTTLDIDNIDYILTTFIPVPQKYGIFYYEKIMDTTGAFRDINDKMFWLIYSEVADEEHVYYLGKVDIVYLQ